MTPPGLPGVLIVAAFGTKIRTIEQAEHCLYEIYFEKICNLTDIIHNDYGVDL